MIIRNRFFQTVAVLAVCCISGRLAVGEDIRVLKDLAYKSNDVSDYERERCKLDLYLPPAGRAFATIVWFHGGGLQQGDKTVEIARTLGRRFADDGIAVASVNYRLHPKVKFPAYIDDAAAAVAFVYHQIERYGGDPRRIFVSGHSAGGYLTAMIGADNHYLEKYGLRTQEIAGLMPIAGQMITHSTVRKERSIPSTRPIIDEAAPAYHVDAKLPPFLCVVGSQDLPARAEENRYFVAAMKAAGHADVTYLEVRGRDHSSIANQIGDADDVVAQAMIAMIRRLAP
jgi:acetyl esterase/lipase